jgi:hypothetical protein
VERLQKNSRQQSTWQWSEIVLVWISITGLSSFFIFQLTGVHDAFVHLLSTNYVVSCVSISIPLRSCYHVSRISSYIHLRTINKYMIELNRKQFLSHDLFLWWMFSIYYKYIVVSEMNKQYKGRRDDHLKIVLGSL